MTTHIREQEELENMLIAFITGYLYGLKMTMRARLTKRSTKTTIEVRGCVPMTDPMTIPRISL